jgi:CRISPR-associated endonuclease/helicase Cas3
MGIKDCYLKIKKYLGSKRGFSERGFLDYLIEKIAQSDSSKPFFINAPTGYGKTAISETIALDEYENGYKTIISYPLRSLIEDQTRKVKELMKNVGAGEEIVGLRYMGRQDSPYLVHPVTLTTVDTLSLTALGISPEDTQKVFREVMGTSYGSLGHYLFSLASVYTSTMVLDEVHLLYDSSKSLSFLKALMRLSEEMGNRLFLMSATIPERFVRKLIGNKLACYEKFSKDHDSKFYEERKTKKYKIALESYSNENKLDKIYELIKRNSFNRALIIFNTVEDAISFYRKLEGKEKILIHSRFSIDDRVQKTKLLEFLTGRTIIVGTQAVEAGLDISSDLIISEIAPPNSLIQRFGRFLRRDEKSGSAYIWYESNLLENADKNLYKVYDKELIKRTVDFLENNQDINLHIGYEEFLNDVYVEEPVINSNLVDNIINIVTNLVNPSESAFKLLIELEGSFVRDGNIFMAKSENNVEVPVSYSFLKKRIKDKILSEREAVIRSLKGEVFEVNGYYDSEVGLE